MKHGQDSFKILKRRNYEYEAAYCTDGTDHLTGNSDRSGLGGYQIKWDGVHTLVRLDGKGGVEIFSKRVEPRNDRFPEIVELLSPLQIGACVLDGEIAYFDGSRPRQHSYDEEIRGLRINTLAILMISNNL
ncbi:ATP-dependent DNA ligase [Paenibacillus sp. FJAT-27812]|uniref:ATP-dependent DNA ligase n=1 Tax=Paenibacillus sp. FJAT-27812 TaxID=1684143 RepID=UPI0006A7C0C9